MTVSNTHCRITRGLDRGCKTFEYTNITRSMHSRTLLVINVLPSTDAVYLLGKKKKTFEFTNIARSMRSRTLVFILASSRECNSIYRLLCIRVYYRACHVFASNTKMNK